MTQPPNEWHVQKWATHNSKSAGEIVALSVWLEQLAADYNTYSAAAAMDLAAAKQRLPAWTIAAHYQAGKQRLEEYLQRRQPLALHDVDHLAADVVDDVLDALRASPHVVLAARTLSGAGIRVLVHIPAWHTTGEYKHAWRAAGEYLATLHPAIAPATDAAVSDTGRLTYPLLIPHGEQGSWNSHTVPLVVPPEISQPGRYDGYDNDSPTLPLDVELERLLDALGALPSDASSGEWEGYVRAAASAGIAVEHVVAWSSTWHGWNHAAEKRLRNIIATNRQTPGVGALIAAAKRHGWDTTYSRWQGHRGAEGGRPAGRASDTTGGNAGEHRQILPIDATAGDATAYDACLTILGVERRYDEIARREEVRLDADKWPLKSQEMRLQQAEREGWLWLTDTLEAEMRGRANDKLARRIEGKNVPQNVKWSIIEWRQQGVAHNLRHSYNPLRAYLTSLQDTLHGEPESWLGLDEHGPFRLVHDTPIERQLAEWAGRYKLVVACARNRRRAKADICPVLTGPQGVGKSSWLWYCLPPQLRHLWRSVDLLDADPKRLAEKLDGVIFSEWAELDAARPMHISRIKALLTDPQISYRPAYGHYLRDIRPQGIIVATSNHLAPLPGDETGNRRFVVVNLEAKHKSNNKQGSLIDTWWSKNRDALWARADQLAQGDLSELLTLPKVLADYQTEQNLENRYASAIEVAARDKLADVDKSKAITTLGLWGMLPNTVKEGTNYSRQETKLRGILRESGYVSRGKGRAGSRTIRYWTLPNVEPSGELAKQAARDEESYLTPRQATF